MRDIKTFARDIIKKPPAIFPWVALFHFVILVYQLWLYSDMPFPSLSWLQPAWLLAYSIAWLFACDMRKWAALLYLGLTMLNLSLYLGFLNMAKQDLYSSPIYLIDVLFSFFILFFYKRFE